jgi:hypothetical protein
LLWFVGIQRGWHPWYRLLGKNPPPTEPIAAVTTVSSASTSPAAPRPQPAAAGRARRSQSPG